MSNTDPRWHRMLGGITRDGDHTIFSLTACVDRQFYGQRISVETARLRARPELYQRTLDWMVRDISKALS